MSHTDTGSCYNNFNDLPSKGKQQSHPIFCLCQIIPSEITSCPFLISESYPLSNIFFLLLPQYAFIFKMPSNMYVLDLSASKKLLIKGTIILAKKKAFAFISEKRQQAIILMGSVFELDVQRNPCTNLLVNLIYHLRLCFFFFFLTSFNFALLSRNPCLATFH